jgi:hypothetical protein
VFLVLPPLRWWLESVAWAFAWLVVLLAYRPVAYRLAARCFDTVSRTERAGANVSAGFEIARAWLLSAIAAELLLRFLLVQGVAFVLWRRGMPQSAAAATGVVVAAAVTGAAHRARGPQAAFVAAQFSLLYGLLYFASGRSLPAVVLCHGLFDTIEIVRARRARTPRTGLGAG